MVRRRVCTEQAGFLLAAVGLESLRYCGFSKTLPTPSTFGDITPIAPLNAMLRLCLAVTPAAPYPFPDLQPRMFSKVPQQNLPASNKHSNQR